MTDIKLSCDNFVFKVPLNICKHMALVKNLVEADPETFEESDHEAICFDDLGIFDENIKKELLQKVIHFCESLESGACKFKTIEKPLDLQVLQHIEKTCGNIFLDMNVDEVIKLTHQSEFMRVDLLHELCCAKIASFIRNKSTEEIRENFQRESDFDKYEEEEIREENKWSYTAA